MYFRKSFKLYFWKSFKLYNCNWYNQCDFAFIHQSLLTQPDDWTEFHETNGSWNIRLNSLSFILCNLQESIEIFGRHSHSIFRTSLITYVINNVVNIKHYKLLIKINISLISALKRLYQIFKSKDKISLNLELLHLDFDQYFWVQTKCTTAL